VFVIRITAEKKDLSCINYARRPPGTILAREKKMIATLDRPQIACYHKPMNNAYQKDLADELANDDSWIWVDDLVTWDDGEDISEESEAILAGQARRTHNTWNQR
jgi:hypothetical protein